MINKGKIRLQPHVVAKIIEFPNKIEETKELHKFLGLLNYSRKFIPNFSTLVQSLYNKISKNEPKYFNNKYVKLVQKIKKIVQAIQLLALLKDDYYKII